MEKESMVRLTDEERETVWGVMKKWKGSSQKGRRTQRLLKADAKGPDWTDKKIAAAFSCRTKTGENVRQRLVPAGFETALHGVPHQPPRDKNGGRENKTRRSSPCVWESRPRGCPTGRCGCWPSRL